MGRRIALISGLPILIVLAGCSLNTRPTVSPEKMAEFWQEPADLERRSLFDGPGGAALAPNPKTSYALLETDDTGFSPGYDVKDDLGREWSVKLGPEARTEVVMSRLLWAMGYHQPNVYYLPSWTLTDNGKMKTEGPARFRLKTEALKEISEWSWRKNPFLDTQPFAGLYVLLVMVNNWDLKSQQNAVYEAEQAGSGTPRYRYVIKDLGASLGKTNWWLPGTRDDVDVFEDEPFIMGVAHNRVKFHFRGAWREPQLIDSITPYDVRWVVNRLAKLSEAQWMDAFRAGGYSEAEAARYIRRLRQKVDEGLRLTSGIRTSS